MSFAAPNAGRLFRRKVIGVLVVATLLVGANAMARTDVVHAGSTSSPNGVFLSASEVAALPMSGPAWVSLKAAADGPLGVPDIADQDNKHGVKTYGVALIYARTGSAAHRAKARTAIMGAIGTEDGGRTLALGRNLAPYVFAADLINLRQLSPVDDARFRNWLTTVRTKNLGNHGRWVTLQQTHENSASNWGGFAGASRIAASAYLEDRTDLDRAAHVLRAFLGERSSYPAGLAWGAYFQPTGSYDASWACSPNVWVGVNPDCGGLKSGALVEDISRSTGNFPTVDDTGRGYSTEVMQGLVLQAEMLRRQGYDPFSWGDSALRRAALWMARPEINALNNSRVSYHLPYLLNRAYGLTLPTKPAGWGRAVGFTDWTHAAGTSPKPVVSTVPVPKPTVLPGPKPVPQPAPVTTIPPVVKPAPGSGPSTAGGTVTLRGVAAGSVVSGTLTVDAVLAGSMSNVRTDWYLDNVFVRSEVRAPYCFSGDPQGKCLAWDSRSVSNGVHLITVVLTHAGGQSVSTAWFEVRN